MANIVVGVDGSAGAERAVAFAVEEARLRGATLEAVSVWQVKVFAGPGFFQAAPPSNELIDALRRVAQDAVDNALEDVDTSGIEVRRAAVAGVPAEVLVDAAKDADLLVVGSRGLGGFRGLLLGSVSQQCAHHAVCPVAIVPPPGRPRGEHPEAA